MLGGNGGRAAGAGTRRRAAAGAPCKSRRLLRRNPARESLPHVEKRTLYYGQETIIGRTRREPARRDDTRGDKLLGPHHRTRAPTRRNDTSRRCRYMLLSKPARFHVVLRMTHRGGSPTFSSCLHHSQPAVDWADAADVADRLGRQLAAGVNGDCEGSQMASASCESWSTAMLPRKVPSGKLQLSDNASPRFPPRCWKRDASSSAVMQCLLPSKPLRRSAHFYPSALVARPAQARLGTNSLTAAVVSTMPANGSSPRHRGLARHHAP